MKLQLKYFNFNNYGLQWLLFNNSLFYFSRTIPSAVMVLIILSSGVSIQTFTFAKSLQLLTSTLLTIPAGIHADKFGRKKSLLISSVTQIIYFLLLYNPSNIHVVIGEIINGIGICFYNGAYEGWLLDLNNEQTSSNKFMNNIIHSSEFSLLSMMIASLFGSLFDKKVFLISVTCLTLVTIIFLLIPDKDDHYLNIKQKNLFIDSAKYLINTRIGILILILGALYTGLMQLVWQFWQPFFHNAGINNYLYFGIIFSMILLSQYVISVLLRRFVYHKLSLSINLCLNWFLASFSMFLLLIIYKNYLIITIILYCGFSGFMNGSNSIIHVICAKNISKYYHATSISIIDFVGRFFGALLFITIIPFIDNNHIWYIWLLLTIIFTGAMICVYLLDKYKWFTDI